VRRSRHEPPTHRLGRSTTVPRLIPYTTRLVAAPDHRGTGRQQRGRQPVVDTRPRERSGSTAPPTATWCPTSPDGRAAGPPARTPAPRRRSVWLARAGLDLWTDRRGATAGMWPHLPSEPCPSRALGDALESAKACSAGPPARRSGHYPRAGGEVAGAQTGAQAQGQRLFCIDEAGFFPLPRVVRT
jgi:hypothetical protein